MSMGMHTLKMVILPMGSGNSHNMKEGRKNLKLWEHLALDLLVPWPGDLADDMFCQLRGVLETQDCVANLGGGNPSRHLPLPSLTPQHELAVAIAKLCFECLFSGQTQ